jgi:hypothetical protein
MVFSMPLEMRANWLFRVTPLGGGRQILAARRRALYALSVVPFWAGSAMLFLWLWPSRAAAGHSLVLALFGITIAEVCLSGRQKIPFTCSYLPGKASFHLTFWLSLALSLMLLFKAADWERSALQRLPWSAVMLAILALAAGLAWRRNVTEAESEEGSLRFEEEAEPVIFTLGIAKDGALITGPLPEHR